MGGRSLKFEPELSGEYGDPPDRLILHRTGFIRAATGATTRIECERREVDRAGRTNPARGGARDVEERKRLEMKTCESEDGVRAVNIDRRDTVAATVVAMAV